MNTRNSGIARASERTELLYIMRRLATKRHISDGAAAKKLSARSDRRLREKLSESVWTKNSADRAAMRLWITTAAWSQPASPSPPNTRRTAHRNSGYMGSRETSMAI